MSQEYIPHKRPKYLSPSALALWDTNKQEFFLRYLAFDKPPRPPQTQPMSVGSAFDAVVKDQLATDLGIKTPALEFDSLFEENVESQNRSFAFEAGYICFKAYKYSGAYHDLVKLLMKADKVVLDERKAPTPIRGLAGEVFTASGVPDIEFVMRGQYCVYDLKARGYCGQGNTSPTAGYILCRDGWSGVQNRSNGEAHKKCAFEFHPIFGEVDGNETLEEANRDWGVQLATYGWMAGAPVGSELFVGIDELCCGPGGIRVAQHRTTISPAFQHTAYDRYVSLWSILHSDWIFRDMTEAESKERCTIMMRQAMAYEGETIEDEWFKEMMKNARS